VGPASPWRRRWRVVVALAVLGTTLTLAGVAAADGGGGSTNAGGSTTDDGGIVAVGHTDGSDDGDHVGGSGRPRHCDFYLQDSAGSELTAGGLRAGPKVSIAELRAVATGEVIVVRSCRWLDTGELEISVVTVSPDPAAVAGRAATLAAARLVLPVPAPRTSPPGRAVDNVATWLWVDRSTTQSATARNAGVTATVVASPVRLVWRTGDGDRVTCAGGGTPFDPAMSPDRQHSDCTHTFSSPTSTVHMSVTEVWRLRWDATNGQSGDLGEVSRAAPLDLRVEELVTVLRSE
jgi:hypothetical protein